VQVHDQAGAGDKSESVERQLAHVRAYAARNGWMVADAHVYVDDGISGAEFGDRRPGLARLLNALRPRPPFQILVMSEESRLGRKSIEVAYALKALVQAGVRVFLYCGATSPRFASCSGRTSPARGRSSGGCWWGAWNARPSTKANGSAIASKRAAHTPHFCPPAFPHLKW